MAVPESKLVDIVERFRLYKDAAPSFLYKVILNNWYNFNMNDDKLYLVLNNYMFKKMAEMEEFKKSISPPRVIRYKAVDVERIYTIHFPEREVDFGLYAIGGFSTKYSDNYTNIDIAKVSLSLLDKINNPLKRVSVYFNRELMKVPGDFATHIHDWLRFFGFKIKEAPSGNSLNVRMDEIENRYRKA